MVSIDSASCVSSFIQRFTTTAQSLRSNCWTTTIVEQPISMIVTKLRPISLLLIGYSIVLPATVSDAADPSPCADQLQRCGVLVEEFERQLHDLRNLAFRNCFTSTACVHEKIAFDDCYAKSLQAMRAPFGNSAVVANNDFLNAAEAFRPRVERCFTGGGAGGADDVLTLMGNNAGGNESAPPTDEVAHLARTVYGTELADRLWGLPPGDTVAAKEGEHPLDPEAACSIQKDPASRMFGGGISRIVDPSSASGGSQLNISCSLGATELQCYSQALGHDPQYRLLVSSRDKALRSCIQNARLQPEGNCQFGPASLACVCNSREELDNRMQSAILDCVQHSSVAQLYNALNSLSRWNPPLALLPTSSPSRLKPTEVPGDQQSTTPPPIALQLGEEPISVSSPGAVLTAGTVVNGQCLCACAKAASVVAAASNDYASRVRAGNEAAATFTTVTALQQQQPQQGVTPVVVQQQYRPLPAMPWYYPPVQTALSAEAGIASGFERFFNGQPPLRKKRQRDNGK